MSVSEPVSAIADPKVLTSGNDSKQVNMTTPTSAPTTTNIPNTADVANTQNKTLLKRSKSSSKSTSSILCQFTIRDPQWTYILLHLVSPHSFSHSNSSTSHPSAPHATPHDSLPSHNQPHSTPAFTTPASTGPDAVTLNMYITSALEQFLGLHGRSIAFDILDISSKDIWIRVQRQDASAFVAAMGGWTGRNGVGLSVRDSSPWGPFSVNAGAQRLFD